jgi:hypothetical protein
MRQGVRKKSQVLRLPLRPLALLMFWVQASNPGTSCAGSDTATVPATRNKPQLNLVSEIVSGSIRSPTLSKVDHTLSTRSPIYNTLPPRERRFE